MLLQRTNLHPQARAGVPRIGFLLTLFVLAAFTAMPGFLTGPAASAQQPDAATYETEIQTGRNFMRQRKWEDALKAFKRANDLKGKTSAEAYLLMADAYMGLDAYKNVAQSADKVIEFAGSDAQLQAQAYNLKAIAIQKQSEGKDQKKLQEAEAVLRQAVTAKADYAESRYNLGIILLQQNRDPEGIVELKKYLELAPDQVYAADAKKIIENPRRAREPFAPDFSITTSEGEYISLDDLKGKVVLLDFWGTWCPPCVASLPALRNLNKKFTKSEKFVILGISSDSDEDKWRSFIAKQEMVWPQFLDRQRAVQRAFRVSAFPTYIVLDHEGVIRFRTTGLSFEKEGQLDGAINKQIKLLEKAASAN
jgi:peroxiredoxin/cytochrome c-type biogenesis protein CcmH/NrfG